MAKKLYLSKELEPTRFLREGESYLTVRALCARALELRAVTGEEQFQFLWDNKDKIPESWKKIWGLFVPDLEAGVVRVLIWSDIFGRWDRYEDNFYDSFFIHDYCRVLVPRDEDDKE